MPAHFPRVEDRFGNKVAPDGELTDGNALFIISGRKKKKFFVSYLKKIENVKSYRGEKRIIIE